MEEERNEINWRIVEKDRNKISLMIEGIGHVNNMEEVVMTCANMCGVQLAMIDIAAGKPILYQFAWKVIRLIMNKKTKTWMGNNADRIAHLPMFFMTKIHQVFMHLASFSLHQHEQDRIRRRRFRYQDGRHRRRITIKVLLKSARAHRRQFLSQGRPSLRARFLCRRCWGRVRSSSNDRRTTSCQHLHSSAGRS